MNDQAQIVVRGEITDVFAHRFVVNVDGTRILADIGPDGLGKVLPSVGDLVELVGEQKPSELKVKRYTSRGESVDLAKHPSVKDVEAALAAVRAAGYTPHGDIRRKPRHFEVDALRGDDKFECHVSHDGVLRKTKPRGHASRPTT